MSGLLDMYADDLDPQATREVMQAMHRLGLLEVISYRGSDPVYALTEDGHAHVESICAERGVSVEEATAYAMERLGDRPRSAPGPGLTSDDVLKWGRRAEREKLARRWEAGELDDAE